MDDVYTSGDVVSAIMTGDNNRAKEGILSMLGHKSMDELEVRKAEIAQNMFNDVPVEEPQTDSEEPQVNASDEVLVDPHTNQEIPEVDPHNGQDIENSEVNTSPTHAPDQPEIPVVDPHSGQPTETLEQPKSASA
jgi:hypothetical protein